VPGAKSIRLRLMLNMAGMAVTAALLVGIVLFVLAREHLLHDASAELSLVRDMKGVEIGTCIGNVNHDLLMAGKIAGGENMALLLAPGDEADKAPVREQVRKAFTIIRDHSRWLDMFFLLDREGNVIVSSNPDDEGAFWGLQPFFAEGLHQAGAHIQTATFASRSDAVNRIVATCPIEGAGGQAAGVLGARASFSEIGRIMGTLAGRGQSTWSYLAGMNQVLLTPVNYPGFSPGSSFLANKPVRLAIAARGEGVCDYVNPAGKRVLAAYKWLPELDGVIVTERDHLEILRQMREIFFWQLLLTVFTCGLACFLAAWMAGRFARPIRRLAAQIKDFDILTSDLRFPAGHSEELDALSGAFEGMTTSLRAAFADIKAAEERERNISDAMNDALFVHDAETGRILSVNKTVLDMFGYSREEIADCRLRDLSANVPPYTEEEAMAYMRRAEAEPQIFEWLCRHRDGHLFWLEVNMRRAEINRHPLILVTGRDISERRRAEEALRESEDRFRSIMEQSPFSMVIYSPQGDVIYMNSASKGLWGIEAEAVAEYNILQDSQLGELGLLPSIRKAFEGEQVVLDPVEYDLSAVVGVGNRKVVQGSFYPVYDVAHALRYVILIQQDVTERMRAETALLESERRYRYLVENLPLGVYRTLPGPEAGFVLANPALCRIFGYESQEEFLATKPASFFMNPDERTAFVDTLVRDEQAHAEFQMKKKDGTPIWCALSARAVRNPDGSIAHFDGFVEDITERRRAEREQERLQEQLIQAHKMESVGRLAGGVAHDFNNMLSVILGQTEMALEEVAPDSPLHEDLKEIKKAAQRSADLTRQLLAFARRQTISPKVVDLNETVSGTLKMLQRLIGEEIVLVWRPAAEVWPVKIDASQIDQVLANLCVNARDAIPGIGRITIETHNVTLDESFYGADTIKVPGDYVVLSVSDSGRGMPPDVLEHLFEPFFTTKGVGEGTGLGLATVYGIVRQNDGLVNVYSEVGKGTTFRIYLPRCLEQGHETTHAKPVEVPPARGHETILLVEDELSILSMGKRTLEKLGYRVLSATSPGEALRVAETHPDGLDLLMTDVVMPEMNGRELAQRIRDLHPEIKLLFMSGYTADVIAHHGVLKEGVHFIQKPFSVAALAHKLRETLADETKSL